MDEDEKEGRALARAMVETIHKHIWEWAKKNRTRGVFGGWFVKLDDLDKYLGVKE